MQDILHLCVFSNEIINFPFPIHMSYFHELKKIQYFTSILVIFASLLCFIIPPFFSLLQHVQSLLHTYFWNNKWIYRILPFQDLGSFLWHTFIAVGNMRDIVAGAPHSTNFLKLKSGLVRIALSIYSSCSL